MDKIVNRDSMPEEVYYAYLQFGKAYRRADYNPFEEVDKVLAFDTPRRCQYFVEHWDGQAMRNYKQACNPEEDHTFWVINKSVSSIGNYFADDMKIYKNEPYKLESYEK